MVTEEQAFDYLENTSKEYNKFYVKMIEQLSNPDSGFAKYMGSNSLDWYKEQDKALEKGLRNSATNKVHAYGLAVYANFFGLTNLEITERFLRNSEQYFSLSEYAPENWVPKLLDLIDRLDAPHDRTAENAKILEGYLMQKGSNEQCMKLLDLARDSAKVWTRKLGLSIGLVGEELDRFIETRVLLAMQSMRKLLNNNNPNYNEENINYEMEMYLSGL